MNNQNSTLQDYFSKASDRPLAFSPAQIQNLLDAADSGHIVAPVFGGQRRGGRVWKALAVGTAVVGLGTGVFFFLNGNSSNTHSGLAVSQRPASVTNDSPAGATVTSPRAQARSTEVTTPNDVAPVAAGAVVIPMRAQPASISAREPRAIETYRDPLRIGSRANSPISIDKIYTIDLAENELNAVGMKMLPNGEVAFSNNLILDTKNHVGEVITDSLRNIMGYSDTMLVRAVGVDGVHDYMQLRKGYHKSSIDDAWQIITNDRGEQLQGKVDAGDAENLKWLLGITKSKMTPQETAEALAKIDSAAGLNALGKELRYNTLLPVRVKLGDTKHGIFWCATQPKLIAGLPARARQDLYTELQGISESATSSDTISVVRKAWAVRMLNVIDSIRADMSARHIATSQQGVPSAATGGRFFNMNNKSGTGLKSVSVSNPNHGLVTVNYTLAEPRTMAFAIYDIEGNKIRDLAPSVAEQDGDGSVKGVVGDLKPGMYQIAVTTEKGERSIQRLIISK